MKKAREVFPFVLFSGIVSPFSSAVRFRFDRCMGFLPHIFSCVCFELNGFCRIHIQNLTCLLRGHVVFSRRCPFGLFRLVIARLPTIVSYIVNRLKQNNVSEGRGQIYNIARTN